MMSLFIKVLFALGVFIIVMLASTLAGGLLQLIPVAVIQTVGTFLQHNAALIGGLAAVWYIVFGSTPPFRPAR